MDQPELPLPDSEDKLVTITRLLDKARDLQLQADELDRQGDSLLSQRDEIVNKILPDLFDTLGMTEIRLSDGSIVKRGSEYYASIPKAKRSDAYEWLREHNMGSIIKQGLEVDAKHSQTLLDAQIPFELEENVHPSTLKALVKEQIEAGNEFPRELFGVFVKEVVTRKSA